MKTIQEIQIEAKKEIFYLIRNKFSEDEKEISLNYNMGLITLEERLLQLKEIVNLSLKTLKENQITIDILNL
jgi:hypothetical protein